MSAIGLTLAMQSYWAANISYLNGSISRNVLNTRSFNMENCLTFVWHAWWDANKTAHTIILLRWERSL